MAVSIKKEFNSFESQQQIELKRAFNALQNDLAALRAGIQAITSKLDNENVTNLDTDYAASCDPAPLELTD